MTIILSNDQQTALDDLLGFCKNNDKFHILSGAAGTGKSTLITEFINSLKRLGIPYKLTATTNKAVNVLNDMSGGGSGGETIFKLLKLRPKKDFNTGKTIIVQDREKPIINEKIIIIDEYSMISPDLLDFITKIDGKILFVGDSYQLLAVGHKTMPVLEHGWKESRLNKVVRQAEDNPIISLATKIRMVIDGGKFPTLKGINSNNEGIFLINNIDNYKKSIFHFFNDTGKDNVKIISWTNDISNEYSKLIRRNLLNTDVDTPQIGEVFITNTPIISNDKVLINTDKEVTILKIGSDSELRGIEGNYISICDNIGNRDSTPIVVESFLPKNMSVVRRKLNKLSELAKKQKSEGNKEFKRTWFKFFELGELFCDIRPSYAITAHKSQGSSYDTVFIDVEDIFSNRDKIEVARLFYVAVTRPKKQLILHGHIPDSFLQS